MFTVYPTKDCSLEATKNEMSKFRDFYRFYNRGVTVQDIGSLFQNNLQLVCFCFTNPLLFVLNIATNQYVLLWLSSYALYLQHDPLLQNIIASRQ